MSDVSIYLRHSADGTECGGAGSEQLSDKSVTGRTPGAELSRTTGSHSSKFLV